MRLASQAATGIVTGLVGVTGGDCLTDGIGLAHMLSIHGAAAAAAAARRGCRSCCCGRSSLAACLGCLLGVPGWSGCRTPLSVSPLLFRASHQAAAAVATSWGRGNRARHASCVGQESKGREAVAEPRARCNPLCICTSTVVRCHTSLLHSPPCGLLLLAASCASGRIS